ncbi:MAG TPA: hypothetical protein VG518_07950 [Solirubrobacterales bacterium]|nr:hypothetical protein [Solirubrobacterales bacterium]
MAVACPKCGGEALKLISPGLYECESFDSDAYICRHRFQTASAPQAGEQAICPCGTYAIGLCAECGQAVCGDHSDMVASKRLCDQHAAVAKADLDERDHEEHARNRRDFEAALAEAVERFVGAMGAAGNPGCRASYRVEKRNGSGFKDKSIHGWGIGRDFFIQPDGSIVRPGGRRRNRSSRGNWLPKKVTTVEEWDTEVFRGADRGGAVSAAFQSVSRSGPAHSPLEAMTEHLERHGLGWPDGYQPPDPSDYGQKP